MHDLVDWHTHHSYYKEISKKSEVLSYFVDIYTMFI